MTLFWKFAQYWQIHSTDKFESSIYLQSSVYLQLCVQSQQSNNRSTMSIDIILTVFNDDIEQVLALKTLTHVVKTKIKTCLFKQ